MPSFVCTLTYALPDLIALIRSDNGWPASGPTRFAAVNVPSARTPSWRPDPNGPGTGAVPGYSQTTIGPATVDAPMWICAMNALSMFDAISLSSTDVPSSLI